ncbi:hypothetical protein FOA52_013053 [Chlamydomonas sp. UWO 241]|nr:hypothetical protein FOA52_013053 [Chlamydomonas sp. UWO 241]
MTPSAPSICWSADAAAGVPSTADAAPTGATAHPLIADATVSTLGRAAALRVVSNVSRIVVVVFDAAPGPCVWAARGAIPPGATGGEFVWCVSLLSRLLARRSVAALVTGCAPTAKAIVAYGRAHGSAVVTLAHWFAPWMGVPPVDRIHGMEGPFHGSLGERCVLLMSFWNGFQVPMPGLPVAVQQAHVLTPWDYGGGNTGTMLGLAACTCDVGTATLQDAMARPSSELGPPEVAALLQAVSNGTGAYGVVFGKWEPGGTARVDRIPGFLRAPDSWEHALSHVDVLVFVSCADAMLSVVPVDRARIVCLPKASALRRDPGLHTLLLREAAFVLGIGSPVLSPTPLTAICCNTSTILVKGQHAPLEAITLGKPCAGFAAVQDAAGLEAALQFARPNHSSAQRCGEGAVCGRYVCSQSSASTDFSAGGQVVAAVAAKVEKSAATAGDVATKCPTASNDHTYADWPRGHTWYLLMQKDAMGAYFPTVIFTNSSTEMIVEWLSNMTMGSTNVYVQVHGMMGGDMLHVMEITMMEPAMYYPAKKMETVAHWHVTL